MIKNLEILFEKYNFDYIYINPKNIDDIYFEFISEEILTDFKGSDNYLGTVKLKDNLIQVFWDKKIVPDNVVFKYKNLSKERNSKLKNLMG